MSKKYFSDLLDASTSSEKRPVSYPNPREQDQLFFIQRNRSTNTVVYKLNYKNDGLLNLDEPMSIYWIKYNDNSQIESLNHIQSALAYGYTSEVVSNDLIKFKFVCHKRVFYIAKVAGFYKVYSTFEHKNFEIQNIYVHIDEFGAFPVVNFVDLFCANCEGQKEIKRLEF